MNRDPTVVGHAKVGAEMFAGVISGFVDELSWKTIVRDFSLVALGTCSLFSPCSSSYSAQ